MIIRKILFALCVTGTLVFFSMDMKKKEDVIQNGRLVYFDMRQRDPRSLMQGDYMHLNYGMENNMRRDNVTLSPEGYVVIWLDSNRVARFIRVQDQPEPLHDTELVVKYRTRKNFFGADPVLGPASFFFEEEKAECFSTARYIEMRVDENGTAILTGLADWDFCRLHEQDSASYHHWLENHPPPPPPPPGID
ncbi:MAG: hypothetical protein FD123_2128 [Bacteroidetes bacterium]|nr:MAG: hypothetical protein FD123_2128 [Bacteroidota bacterium]